MENPDNNMFSANGIQEIMKTEAKVFYSDIIDSTNSEAKRHIAKGLCSPAVFIAKEQTAGKGRQGKRFFSPADTGLYMSVVVLPNSSFSDAVFLTTATAVAVCRVIERHTGIETGIKWVNDIFYRDKKVGGILAEAINDYNSSTVKMAIIGVGINIATTIFPEDIANVAGSLEVTVSKAKLCAEIADEIYEIIGDLSKNNYIDEYRKRSVIIGKNISFLTKGITQNGYAKDIDDYGGLIVETEEGETILRSGEITIREFKKQTKKL